MKPASTVTVAVFTAFASGFFTAGLATGAEEAVVELAAGAAEAGAGVPLRLALALTVRSLP